MFLRVIVNISFVFIETKFDFVQLQYIYVFKVSRIFFPSKIFKFLAHEVVLI